MKIFNRVVVIVVSLLLSLPPAVMADVVGKITYIEGRTDRLDETSGRYLPLVVGDEISLGDVVRTKSYSKAEITFDDDSVVRMGQGTQVKVSDYQIAEGGRVKSSITLDRGNMRAIVSKKAGPTPFEIVTPNASGTVKGSDLFVSFMQSSTKVFVAEGLFSMKHTDFPKDMVDVSEGMAGFVPYNEPPVEPRVYNPREIEKLKGDTGPTVHMMKGVAKRAEFTTASVAKVAGTVRVQPRGSKKWHAPVKSEVLNMGDRVETGKSGKMLITFDNGLSIELNSGTQLLITRLTRDPKTGNFQNVFEARYGKIISRIQNMPEKSTFEIKTPHAVCGIRGTIMYLDILPTLTKSFYEGGGGYVKNVATGVSKIIKEGITSTIDGEGNGTEEETSDEDRSSFGSEWGNESDDEYGYTDDNTPDEDADPPGEEGSEGPDEGPPGSEGGDDGEFDGIVPEVDGDGDPGEEPEKPQVTSGIVADVDAKYGYFGSFAVDEGTQISSAVDDGEGLFISEPGGSWAGGSRDASLIASFSNPANPDPESLFFGDINGEAGNEGQIFGYFCGSDIPVPAGNDWEAVVAALFVDPSNTAGILFANLAGDYDGTEEGGMIGNGDVFFLPFETVEGPVEPGGAKTETVEDVLSGKSRTGDVELDLIGVRKTMTLNETSNFGIWEEILKGYYDRPDGVSEWTVFVGKSGAELLEVPGGLGEYRRVQEGTLLDGPLESMLVPGVEDQYYGFYTIEGIDDLNGYLHMDVLGVTMDLYNMGSVFGTIVGTYAEANSYELESIGSGGWMNERLSYVSPVVADMYVPTVYTYGQYYYDTEGSSGHYYYNYYADNTYGYSRYYQYFSDNTYNETQIEYNRDGTTDIRVYQDSGTTNSQGTWDTSRFLGDILDTPPPDYYSSYQETYAWWDRRGSINALLGSTDSFWDGSSSAVLMGEFDILTDTGTGTGTDTDHPAGQYMWSSDIGSYNAENDTYTTYDGGAFRGYAAGTLYNPIKGLVAAVYVAPDGSAGTVTGKVEGDSFPEIGFLFATGDLYSTKMTDDAGVLPEDLVYSVYSGDWAGGLHGMFSGNTGNVEADESLETLSIVDFEGGMSQRWGVYRQWFAGWFDNPQSSSTWSAKMGGDDGFDLLNTEYGYPNHGFWLADLTSGTWEGSEITAILNGTILTPLWMGTIEGDVVGLYDEENNTWLGAGAGVWQSTAPLTFNGSWGGEYSTLYGVGEDGDLYRAGDDWGLVGATGSPWNAEATMKVLGNYSLSRETDLGAVGGRIWNTVLQSMWYDGDMPRYTTHDGGAFFGFSVGNSTGGTLYGDVILLYIDPDGKAGILRGGLNGNYYEAIEMFEAESLLSRDVKDQDIGVSPESLKYSYFWGYDHGRLSGRSDSGWYFEGEDMFRTANIVDPETGFDSDWGIYSQSIWGTFGSPEDPRSDSSWVMGGDDRFGHIKIFDEWQSEGDYGYWIATVRNGGFFDDNSFEGRLAGEFLTHTRMGTINGKVDGRFSNETGMFQAVGLGEWSGESLMLSGLWGDDDYSLYGNDDGYGTQQGEDWGLIGATDDLWGAYDSPADMLAMGMYEADEDGKLIWLTPVSSYNAAEDNFTTIDGGAFYGRSVGLWDQEAGELEGGLFAIYMSPSGEAGVVYTKYGETLNGDVYPGIGMWKLHGGLYIEEMPSEGLEISRDPADLMDEIREDGIGEMYFRGYFLGPVESNIEGHGLGKKYMLGEEASWGLFEFMVFGREANNTFEGREDATEWVAASGEDFEGEYHMNFLEGAWDDGNISGTVTGVGMDRERVRVVKGDVYGVYDDPPLVGGIAVPQEGEGEGTWAAISAGVYTEERLSHVSVIEDGTFVGFRFDDFSPEDEPYESWDIWFYAEPFGEIDASVVLGERYAGILFEEEEYGFLGFTFGPGMEGLMGGSESIWTGDPAATSVIARADTDDGRPSHIWFSSPVYSQNMEAQQFTTYDGGSYYGYLVGAHRENDMEALFIGLGIDPAGRAGTVSGEFQGRYAYGLIDDGGDLPDMFFMNGEMVWDPKTPEGAGIEPDELVGYMMEESDRSIMAGIGFHSDPSLDELFRIEASVDPPEIIAGLMLGESISFMMDEEFDDNWGVWASGFAGIYAGDIGPEWEMPFVGAIINVQDTDFFGDSFFDVLDFDREDTEMIGAYLMGLVAGEEWMEGGRISGEVSGLWVSTNYIDGDDGPGVYGIQLGTMNGKLIGNNSGPVDIGEGAFIELDEEFSAGTWEAGAAGEWVEVSELMDVEDLVAMVEELAEFDVVTMPFSGVLQGDGFGHINDAVMDIALFAHDSAIGGIWAAFINGTYDTGAEIGPDWGVDFDSGIDTDITLYGLSWGGGEWSATVEGELEGNPLAGTAAGTYADGDFDGAGAGVWVDGDVADAVSDLGIEG